MLLLHNLSKSVSNKEFNNIPIKVGCIVLFCFVLFTIGTAIMLYFLLKLQLK